MTAQKQEFIGITVYSTLFACSPAVPPYSRPTLAASLPANRGFLPFPGHTLRKERSCHLEAENNLLLASFSLKSLKYKIKKKD